MVNHLINNFIIIIIVSLLIYFVFSSLNISSREGMSNSTSSISSSNNGIGGNAASYGAQIKSETIKLQDTMLISKYRKDYETAIINIDDYIDNMMLQTTLNIDLNKPMDSIDELNKLYNAKSALNSVMKFVDKS